jgi:hypothetical protein
MQRTCEVCENFRNRDDLSGLTIVEVQYDARSVLLCTGHAKIAQNSGVDTFEQLRELFGSGRRSYVPRRRPAALQPDGTGRKVGRRMTDG